MMKRLLPILAIIATACSSGQGSYRNLALLRSATHSSSYDYNQTAQLVTDGIVAASPAKYVEVLKDGEPLARHMRSYLMDINHTGVACEGPSATLEIIFHGYGPVADKIIVAAGGDLASAQISVDGAGTAKAVPTKDKWGENKLIMHDWEFVLPLAAADTLNTVRLHVENAPEHFSVSEVFLYLDGEVQDILSGRYFTSSWKSLGAENEWVAVDLGELSSFDKVVLDWINAPSKGVLQSSVDGAAWHDIVSFEGAAEEISFPETEGRYVRLFLEKSIDGQPFELSEMEVWGRGGAMAKPKETPALREGNRLSLCGRNWELRRVEGPDVWLRAKVPGTVLGAYVDNGAVPDPNYSDNQLYISDSYFRSDFLYRTTFNAEADSERQFLHFEGINYQADITLNGASLGRIDGAFRTADFDVTGILKGGENSLEVLIHPNSSYGAVKEQTAYTPDSNGGVLGADNPTMHATIGWDWIPTVRGRNIGIYDEVYISYTGPVTVEDPFVRTELALPDTLRATVHLGATLVNHSEKPVDGNFLWSFGELSGEIPVSLEPGEKRDIAPEPQILQNPRLWWPKGYGEQNLYPASFSFREGDRLSDLRHFLSGVRQMDYKMEQYTPLRGYQGGFHGRNDRSRLNIYINGRRFIGFGGNWGFPEHLLNYSAREYDAAVRYHAEMNFTMIRNWVGMTSSKDFYEACDRYGIMIWQDFWLANPWDGPDPSDPDRFNEIAQQYVRRIRNHPSIALYVGRNEGYPPEEIDSYLREMVSEEHPGLYYISHSAADGVSGGGPYHALQPSAYFHIRGRDKFHSEMGMPAVMNYENMVRAMGEEALEPVNTIAHPNPMYGLHDYTLGRKAGAAQQTESFNELLEKAFGEPADAREFAELAQWINYNGYRAMFEGRGEFRRGLLLWMSHPAWPSMVWQTYDYYFEPTGAYFGCKKACEPIHIQLNQYSGNVEVVNYHAGRREGLKAKATVLDMEGKQLCQAEENLSLDEDDTFAFPLVLTEDLTEVYYVKLSLSQGGQVLSSNFYVQGKEEGNFKALRTLPKASVEATCTGGETKTVILRNTGDTPALMIKLSLKAGGKSVAPVIYSDNYISLMPGESVTVTVQAAPEDINGPASVEVSAFNMDTYII